jgi:hypothetical protein
VDVCLAGPSHAGHLKEALSALDQGPLSDDEMVWMRRVGAHIYQAKTAKSFSRTVDLADRLVGLASTVSRWVER